jgi:hypothetical protein
MIDMSDGKDCNHFNWRGRKSTGLGPVVNLTNHGHDVCVCRERARESEREREREREREFPCRCYRINCTTNIPTPTRDLIFAQYFATHKIFAEKYVPQGKLFDEYYVPQDRANYSGDKIFYDTGHTLRSIEL